MSTSNNYPQNLFSSSDESTILLCAFSGWNDAGNASVDTLDFLNRTHNAQPIPAFDVSRYFNFTEARPQLSHVGGTPIIEWPTLSVHQFFIGNRKIITLTGEEPHLTWAEFVKDFYQFAQAHAVREILFLGALLGENPHTRPFPLSISSYDESFNSQGVSVQTYNGPTGIVGVLAAFASKNNCRDLSFWVSIPHYAGNTPQPKASYELAKAISRVLGVPLDLKILEDEKDAWERGAKELLEEEPELARYVKQLEEQSEDTAVTGDDIAAAFEQYLKGKDL